MRSRLGDDGRVKPNWRRGPGGADLHSGQGLAAMADGLNVRPPTFSNHHIARLLTSLPRGRVRERDTARTGRIATESAMNHIDSLLIQLPNADLATCRAGPWSVPPPSSTKVIAPILAAGIRALAG